MSTFTFTPDFGASVEVKPRVRVVRFGDGYEQRVGDGINTKPQNWSLRFSNRDDAEAAAIVSFLDARGGFEAFNWTPLLASTPIRVVCREWNRSIDRHNLNTVTATFEQVFEP